MLCWAVLDVLGHCIAHVWALGKHSVVIAWDSLAWYRNAIRIGVLGNRYVPHILRALETSGYLSYRRY